MNICNKFLFYTILISSAAFGYNVMNVRRSSAMINNVMNELIEHVIKYAFSEFPCVQITFDGSAFSKFVVKEIMKRRVLLSTFSFAAIDNCFGHLVISKNDYFFTEDPLIMNTQYRYRTVFICQNISTLNPLTLNNIHNQFENSDGLLCLLEKSLVLKAEYTDPILSEIKLIKGSIWPKEVSGIQNFNNKLLKVAGYNCCASAQIGPKKRLTGPPIWVKGIDMRLVTDMSKKFNFSYTVVVPPGEDWGRGALEGDDSLIDMVKTAEVDMGVCGIWYTYDLHIKGIERSASVVQVSLRLLVPKSPAAGVRWYQVFLPFKIFLWIFLAICILVLSIILKYFAILSQSDLNTKYKSLGYNIFKVFSIFVFGSVPRSESMHGPVRYIILSWVIVATTVTSLYSSCLISHLTTEYYPRSVNSIKDLVHYGYRLLAPNAIDPDLYFNTSDIWERALVNRVKEVQNPTEMAHFIKTEDKIAVLGKSLQPGYILAQAKNLTNWRALPLIVSRHYMGMIYPQGSGLRPSAEKFLLRYAAGGLIQRELRMSLEKAYQKNPAIKTLAIRSKPSFTPDPAGLKTKCLNGPFVLLGTGLAISLLAFFIEHLTYNSSLNKEHSFIYLKIFKMKWLLIRTSGPIYKK